MKLLPDPLPTAVYSSSQVRTLDRRAIDTYAIAGFELMSRAAAAALAALLERWPAVEALTIFCGAGNNAGDGYVLARLAHAAGIEVSVVAVGAPAALRGDAAEAWSQCRAAGVPIGGWAEGMTPPPLGIVVDALLGTGLTRDLEGAFAAAVQAINGSGLPVLALDVPSGLDADTGHPRGVAVRADLTITFVGLKQGLFLGVAPDYCGDLAWAGLAIPERAAQDITAVMTRLSIATLRSALAPRLRTAHKAAHGRLLLAGGGPGMGGAIRLAAEAALRAGAGLVYVATHVSNVATVLAGRPEIICRGVESPADLADWLDLADALVIGPGLGQTTWAESLWRTFARDSRPCVADADALNLLARESVERANWVLTPHPGEAGRLLGRSAHAIGLDRYASAVALARRYRAAVVLKGACSLIAQVDESDAVTVAVCDRGNPGMATAGTGDVLAGVIGALLVQGCGTARAAQAGVLLHALAGDDAARDGQRGMVAGDLLPFIRRWANPE